jgi:serine/threonine-protein phosphatase 2A regulatory subunit B
MEGDASGSAGPWRFAQCFGDKGDADDITEGENRLSCAFVLISTHLDAATSPADIISTVEFDHTGDYLATGDKGGRVVLFERNDTVSSSTL